MDFDEFFMEKYNAVKQGYAYSRMEFQDGEKRVYTKEKHGDEIWFRCPCAMLPGKHEVMIFRKNGGGT